MTAQQFSDILARTEGGPSTASWPDGGRALGPWQFHPDALFYWSTKYRCYPKLNEQWDPYIERLVQIIFLHNPDLTPLVIAMWIHKGHEVNGPANKDWDTVYAARFEEFAESQGV